MRDVDVAIIGSGAGGLAAAVALARAGRKVLVVEQHYVPGGWCHSFMLGGHRYSPGVHYVGELGPGGRMRAIYEGLGVSEDVEFCELNPEGFDRVLVGGQRFDIPKGRARFAARLAERFPAERRGIEAFLLATERLAAEVGKLSTLRSAADLLALPWRAPTLARWGMRSTRAFVAHHVRDPLLAAILVAQSGDHGLPPSRCPAAVHASVMAHYFEGGFYPRGGGFAIPRAFVRALKRAGGEIVLRRSVERILLRDGAVAGLRLAGGEEISARHVVSNADPGVTFGKLLPPAEVPRALRRRLARTRYSTSALSLFVAVDMDLRAAGLDSGNVWHYGSPDLEKIYRMGMSGLGMALDGEIPALFATATTLKDPSKHEGGLHTMEAFTFVGHDAFSTWAASRYGDRPADYTALKDDLKGRMIRALDRVVPGIASRIRFSELGTPLSNRHYVAATEGNLYGTEKSRFQVGPFGWPVRTPIEGLLMCGASTLGHGVMGATWSGLVAAAAVLGCRKAELLSGSPGPPLRIYPSDDPASWPEGVLRRGAGGGAHARRGEHQAA